MSEIANSTVTASNGIDEIAALFDGELEDDEQEGEQLDDSKADTPTDESTESEEEGESEEPETWAKALGVEDEKIVVDDEGNLKGFNVKIDDQVQTVSVSDLIKGYQTEQYVTKKSQALSAEKKEFEAVAKEALQTYTKKIEQAERLNDYLQQSLLNDFQSVDWQTLRVQNPAEYAAAIQDYQIRSAEIEKVKAAIGQEKQQTQSKQQEEQQKHMTAYLQGQVEQLLVKNPEWHDQTKFATAMTEMGKFVNEHYGFTAEEFNNVYDARMFEVLKDAMAYKKGASVAEKKLAKPLPKFQKTTGVSTKTLSKADLLIKKAATAKPGHQRRNIENDAIAALLTGV